MIRGVPFLVLGLVVLRPAGATVVERIVAVVGERAVMLSELRERARPEVQQVYRSVPDPASRAAATSSVLHQVLQRMVDEIVEQQAAARMDISVDSTEVERAVEMQARQNDLSVERLFEEVRAGGLTPAEYRAELRRQLLSAKLANVTGQSRRPQVTERDLQDEYRRSQLEDRKGLEFRAAAIRFPLPADPARVEPSPAWQQANELARRVRAGERFAELAQAHGASPRERERGGVLDATRTGLLPEAIDRTLLGMAPGDVQGPLHVGPELWVITLIDRDESSLPTFAEARAQLLQRVHARRFVEARRRWLDGLRRQTHVELR